MGLRMFACSRIDKCRIRRIWSCNRISDRRTRDFSAPGHPVGTT